MTCFVNTQQAVNLVLLFRIERYAEFCFEPGISKTVERGKRLNFD